MLLPRRAGASLSFCLCNDLCGQERTRSYSPADVPLSLLSGSPGVSPAGRIRNGEISGAWSGGHAWSRISGIHRLRLLPGLCFGGQTVAPLRSAVTVRTPSRRVLKLPPVAQGQDMGWLSWALCLLEGAHRSFHADGAVLMSLREVFFEVPRRGRCCVVICFFHTMPTSADPLLIRPVVPGWLRHWQRALKLWSGIRSHRKEGDNHAIIQ